MARSQPKRVAVIGAGVVGACAALELQRRGHEAILIDPKRPGEGASYGNAGCLNGSSIVPMSMPGVLRNVPGWLFDPGGPLSIRWRYLPQIAPWLLRFIASGTPAQVERQAEALRRLLAPTVAGMQALAAEAGVPELVRHDGHLYVYRSEAGFAKDAGGWGLRAKHGVELDVWDGFKIRDFDPALSPDYVRGVFIRENGHTPNPSRLVKALARKALGNREMVAGTAQGFVLEHGALRAVRTSAGDVAADAAVVAAGAHSRALAAELGDRVLLDTERGYHVVIREPEAYPRVPTTEAEGKFVANPMEAGLRLAGTVELGGLNLPPDWRRARMLLDQARKLLPGLGRDHGDDRIDVWMGFRPSLPDSLPVIGRSRRSPDVVYAFGHGHVGLTAAPATAAIVAALVSGEPPPIPIEAFSPQRFERGARAAA